MEVMRIKSIMITLEKSNDDAKDHGTIITFDNGMWSANGPIYSRVTPALHEIWKILRDIAND